VIQPQRTLLFVPTADQVYGDQDLHDEVRSNCMDYMVRARTAPCIRSRWFFSLHFFICKRQYAFSYCRSSNSQWQMERVFQRRAMLLLLLYHTESCYQEIKRGHCGSSGIVGRCDATQTAYLKYRAFQL